MKDEIKEKIPFNVRDVLEDINSNILWNYITNLQEELRIMVRDDERNQETIIRLTKENERLKKVLNCKEYFSSTMPEDTEFVILTKNNYDRQQKDIQFELIDYKSRCEKAIEKINREYYIKEHEWNDRIINEVLNILQNGSEENG